MDDIDREELERRTRKNFNEKMDRQMRLSRRLMLLIYGIIGLVFLIMGAVFLIVGIKDEESGMNPGMIFAPMGGFFVLLGVILYAVMPKKFDAEKAKRRAAGGRVNYYDSVWMMTMQQTELEMLKERVDELEDDVRRLKNR